MENPIKMDDLGGTPIFGNIHMTSLLKISTSLHKMPPPMSVLGFQVHPQICHAAGRKHGCEFWAAGSSRYFQTSTEPQDDTFGMPLQAVYNL